LDAGAEHFQAVAAAASLPAFVFDVAGAVSNWPGWGVAAVLFVSAMAA
jgi:hypothetical protein